MSGPDVTKLVQGLKAEREAREARLKDLVNDLLVKPAAPAATPTPTPPPVPSTPPAPDPSEALRAEIARLRAEKEGLIGKNVALYEELQAKAAAPEAGDLARQLEDSREALAREQAAAARLREQLGEVQDRVEPLQRRVRESEMRLASAEVSQAGDLARQLEAGREALAWERSVAVKLREQLSEAHAQMESLQGRLRGSETGQPDAAASTRRITELERSLQAERDRSAALEAELASARAVPVASPVPSAPAGSALEARLLEVVQQVQVSRKDWLDALLKEITGR